MNICLKNNGKNCLAMKIKTISKDDGCCSAYKKTQLASVVLSVQVKPTKKNFAPFFEPELGSATYTRMQLILE